ncbi:MAG: MMPL family transporter [Clostridia bacterium]|nr:MMPL family transporter [Clostridia bacterium]
MKRKIAAFMIRFRIVILALMLILAVFSAFSIRRTRINYDLTRYLDERTMTRRALQVMEEEFGASDQLRLMFADLTEEEMDQIVAQLNARPEILLAAHDADADVREKDGKTWKLVTVTLRECDAAALVQALRAQFPDAGPYFVGGAAAALLDVQNSVGEEIPLVMVIAVAVVLIVLLLTSHAWLEPLVILTVLALSILINLGTNFIFPDVSFITFAVSAILQLALSIDYAIMLLHAYNGYCDEGLAARDAMTEALAQCFMRISSSALTTVAGLLSLLFMSFTIGFDIGLVLSKGIVISLLGVFLMMPALILFFEAPLRRTRHKPLRLGGEHLARGIFRRKKAIVLSLILLIICGAALQSQNTYTFTDAGQAAAQTDSRRIDQVFGASNPLALLIPGGDTDADYDTQLALVERLRAIPLQNGQSAIADISAMVTTGAEALKYYTPQDVAGLTGMSTLTITLFFRANGFGDSVRADKLLAAAGSLAGGNATIASLQSALSAANAAFHGPHYDRMLLNLNLSPADAQLNGVIDRILSETRALYGEDFYITGTPMSTYDIGNAFRSDLLKVNIITFLAILLIVALSFRSFRLPVLLVFVIEGAIWITMGLSRALGQPIFFMSYLICVSIQMGATIDYGILLSDQYRSLRRAGRSAFDSLSLALKKSMPTVLTSGVILITAGFIIGKICTVYYIASIGALLSRGALISVLLVLTLLPALLTLADRFLFRGKDAPTK